MDLNFTYVKKVFRCSSLLFLFMIPAYGLLMAQVKFNTVVSPKKAALNEYIQLDYIIENAKSVENFSPPQFKNFDLVQGPSQSSNMTIINGVMSQSQTFSYVLQPQKPGKQVISGAIAIIDGKTMRSDAVTIAVDNQTKSRPAVPSQQPSLSPLMPDIPEFRPGMSEDYRLAPGEDADSKIAKNLFIKLDVNKTTCYAGEPVIATYKLYSRLRSESRIIKRPSLNGFGVYDMDVPDRERVTVEKINGRDFHVQILRRVQLLPLQAGDYTLEPVEMENKVDFVRTEDNAYNRPRSNNPMQRIIDEFFNRHDDGILEEHSAITKSTPVTIRVMALPQENKPAGFNGAVGKFSMKAVLKKKDLTAGDVAQLSVTIRGKGNIPMINAPQLTLPDDMETFEPSVSDTVNKAAYPLSGEKRIDYTFLLGKQGDYTIPPVNFSYFDPVARTYKTIRSDTFAIKVAANSKLAAQRPNTDQEKPGSSSKWTDIIKIEMVVIAIIILLLLGIIIYLLKRNQVKNSAPEKETTPDIIIKEEAEVGTDPLQNARTALVEGKNQGFYSEVNKALREAVCKRTATSTVFLTKGNIPFILQEKGVPAEIIEEVESLMKKCEIALYTPVYQERDRVVILEKAETVIKSLEEAGKDALVR